MKVIILHGEHKNKIGTVQGMFWYSNVCVVKFDNDDSMYSFKMDDVIAVK